MAETKRKICITKTAKETQKLGEILAKSILGGISLNPAVVALKGDLGSGKTTFLQGFARGLGIKEKILSPTFVILKRFSIKKSSSFKNFYHIDCYRLKSHKDLSALGVKNIFKEAGNIVALEWPERVRGMLPKNILALGFNFIDKETRKISSNKNLFKC